MTFDYDQRWEREWDDMKRYGPMSRHVRRIITEMIGRLSFESVLDVGCGQGSFLEELLLEFPKAKAHGCDVSATAVELARARIPIGQFWILDVEKDALDGKFDLVVCSDVLEHIPDDVSALRNLARMTGKNLIISTVQGRTRRFEIDQMGHVRSYGREELLHRLGEAGLISVRVVEWGFPFYSPLYRGFLELVKGKGTTGAFGPSRKLVASVLYYLFMLNSSKRGDEIFVLAEPAQRPVEAS